MPLEGQEGHASEEEQKHKQHAHVEGELVGLGAHVGEDHVPGTEGADDVEAVCVCVCERERESMCECVDGWVCEWKSFYI